MNALEDNFASFALTVYPGLEVFGSFTPASAAGAIRNKLMSVAARVFFIGGPPVVDTGGIGTDKNRL
jgi:hypothetical protein